MFTLLLFSFRPQLFFSRAAATRGANVPVQSVGENSFPLGAGAKPHLERIISTTRARGAKLAAVSPHKRSENPGFPFTIGEKLERKHRQLTNCLTPNTYGSYG